jgi:hypothetical protein
MSEISSLEADRLHGNYILTYGRHGSGKTTFQNFLLRYLSEGNPYFLIEPAGSSYDNEEALFLLQDWQAQWRSGALAPATPVGDARCFQFTARPVDSSRNLPELTFGIFEIAGEDYASIVKSRQNPEPQFPQGLHRFLSNTQINFLIVLMCDGEDPTRDDSFFESFIDLFEVSFDSKFVRQFWSRTPILLIFSKPEQARGYLTHVPSVQRYANTDDEYILIEEFLPRTHKKIQERGIEFEASFLNIGELDGVSRVDPGEGLTIEKRLTRPDYSNISDIFVWIYKYWCKKHPFVHTPTLWAHLKQVLGL